MKPICLSALLLTGCFLFESTDASAQNSGFYGRKRYVEANGMGCWALFNQFNKINNQDNLYDHELHRAPDLFNIGFNVGAGYVMKRNVMIGLETSFWYFSVAGPNYLTTGESYYNALLTHEALDIRTIGIIPTFTFGGKKGLLPVGLNHQVGIGYTKSKVREKDYSYRAYQFSDYDQAELDSMNKENGSFVDYENKYAGFVAVYTIKARVPVNKSIMINWGLRYTLNIISDNNDRQSDFKMKNYELYSEIRRANFRSLLTLNLGVTFAF